MFLDIRKPMDTAKSQTPRASTILYGGDPKILRPSKSISSSNKTLSKRLRSKDEVCWFPMRVTYNRELVVKAILDQRGVESFVPMRYEVVDRHGKRERKLLPAIHNLIFIRSSQNGIYQLKHSEERLESLRFMMSRPDTLTATNSEVIVVPDSQMQNFIRVASAEDDSVMFLDRSDYPLSAGRHVRVLEGPFSGVEGVIRRIQNNRKVVVQITGVAAVAITYLPMRCLETITI